MKQPSIWPGKPQILIFPRAPLLHPIHQQFLVVLPPKIFPICLLLFTTTQFHSIIISFLDNLLTGSTCLHTGISSIHSPSSSWRKPLNANANMLLPCSEAFSVLPLLLDGSQGLNPTYDQPSPASPAHPMPIYSFGWL